MESKGKGWIPVIMLVVLFGAILLVGILFGVDHESEEPGADHSEFETEDLGKEEKLEEVINKVSFYQCGKSLPYGIDDAVWGLGEQEFEDYVGTNLEFRYDKDYENIALYEMDHLYVGDNWTGSVNFYFEADNGLVSISYVIGDEESNKNNVQPVKDCLDDNCRYLGDVVWKIEPEDDDECYYAVWETKSCYVVMMSAVQKINIAGIIYLQKDWMMGDQTDDEIIELRRMIEHIRTGEEMPSREPEIFGMSDNGNTNLNLKNGGWVAEQGDWNYYAIENNIYKENVITGDKIQIFYTSGNCRHLCIMDEWIYFISDDNNEYQTLYKVKTDGSEHRLFFLGEENLTSSWDTWNGDVYLIASEHVSASQKRYFLAKLDWERYDYDEVAEIPNNYYPGGFIGIEDGYAYFTCEEATGTDYYHFCAVDIETGYVLETSWQDEEENSEVGRPFLNQGYLCFLYTYRNSGYGISNTERYSYLLTCNLRKDSEFNWRRLGFDIYRVPTSAMDEGPYIKNVFNSYGAIDELIFGGEEIVRISADGQTEFVVADSNHSICVAHGKIYYRYGNDMYCEISMDGSEWREIRQEEYINMCPF